MNKLANLSLILIKDKAHSPDNDPIAIKTQPIQQFGDFTICYLEQCHRNEVLYLCLKEFTNKYPLMQAFIKAYPDRNHHQSYYHFWNKIIDAFIGNKLSTVAIHKQTKQIAAVALNIDYLQTSSEVFMEELSQETWGQCAYGALRDSLLKQLNPQVQYLLKIKGLVAEAFVAVVGQRYQSQKIVNQMAFLSLKLMKREGYLYAFGFPTNCITKYISQKTGGIKIAQCRADNFQFHGERVFREVEKQHNYPALYIISLKDIPII